ncbi:50S ribosomal protein L44e [Nanoarchaeota archaeon]|nr:MAG: 50S ribosomal protein L44e [Nanoarchaeota archaeon]
MKVPKTIKTYCKHCKKHTEHKVTQLKGSRRGVLGKGRRKLKKLEKGYGGSPYPKYEKASRVGVKVTKKAAFKLTCKVCGKSVTREGIRLKKVEMV